jgi:hypothetical protein
LSNEALCNLASAEPVRFGTTQNPQHVVLRSRNAVRFQRAFERVLEQRRRSLNAEMRLLFQALERPRLLQLLLQFGWHPQILRVITRIVKTTSRAFALLPGSLLEPFRSPCFGARRPFFPVARRGCGHQRIDQVARDLRNVADRSVKGWFVGLRWLCEP